MSASAARCRAGNSTVTAGTVLQKFAVLVTFHCLDFCSTAPRNPFAFSSRCRFQLPKYVTLWFRLIATTAAATTGGPLYVACYSLMKINSASSCLPIKMLTQINCCTFYLFGMSLSPNAPSNIQFKSSRLKCVLCATNLDVNQILYSSRIWAGIWILLCVCYLGSVKIL